MAIVLVVEDRISIRELLKVVLKSHHQVVTASEAAEVIKLAKRTHPNLILLNLHLGKHKGGLAVCRALRRDNDSALVQIPILVVADMISEADMMAAFAAGATDCLNKPHDPLAFLDVINTALFKPHI